MKLALLALACWLCLGSHALRAQSSRTLHESLPNVKTVLSHVVSRQLAAFAAGDFPTAYGFAAVEIKEMFPPEAFEQMVRAKYAIMLTLPQTDFGVSLDDGERGVLFVRLTGPNVAPVLFRYTFVFEEGRWKIIGVEQVEDDPGKPQLTA